MRLLLLFAATLLVDSCAGSTLDCTRVLSEYGLSRNYNETVAHAVHSMTVQGLALFSSSASADNFVPTVDRKSRVGGQRKVLLNAPDDPLGSDFRTHALNTIDKILSNLGKPTDGLGENWSPLERLVHSFHMWDLWISIQDVYKTLDPAPKSVCNCLLDTEHNGILQAVQWVADHYETGTPITLLNRPIPELVDAQSWSVWRSRLLHYYTPAAVRDAATFLQCHLSLGLPHSYPH